MSVMVNRRDVRDGGDDHTIYICAWQTSKEEHLSVTLWLNDAEARILYAQLGNALGVKQNEPCKAHGKELIYCQTCLAEDRRKVWLTEQLS